MRLELKAAYLFLLTTLASASASGQIIVAHRGASYDAPENTLAAFNLAWDQGADGIEGDFYLTSDGKIICIHDKDTLRTAGVKHVVSETPFDLLRTLEVGSWKNEKFRGERMPTFEEVAATVPEGKKFVIELKTGPEIVTPLAEALAKSSLELDQVLIIAFDADTVAECKRQLPKYRVHWLTGYKEDPHTGEWKPDFATVERTLKSSKADGLGSQANRSYIDEEFLENLCDAGVCEFHVWTVDDPKLAKFYQKLGAFGITTNRPGRLRAQLEKSRAKEPALAPASAK